MSAPNPPNLSGLMAWWIRQIPQMQEIHSSNPPVVTGVFDSNKSRARHHRSLKLGSKLKYLKISQKLLNGRGSS